jgi:5-methylcytosine-specific restriction endonuclease McrA
MGQAYRTIPLDQLLRKDTNYQSNKIRLRLLEEGLKPRTCESCGLSTWLDQPIPLELDHIDGDKTNNELFNLRILCPNCHAQTVHYRGRNMKKFRSKGA